jgi:hypothetical protein
VSNHVTESRSFGVPADNIEVVAVDGDDLQGKDDVIERLSDRNIIIPVILFFLSGSITVTSFVSHLVAKSRLRVADDTWHWSLGLLVAPFGPGQKQHRRHHLGNLNFCYPDHVLN